MISDCKTLTTHPHKEDRPSHLTTKGNFRPKHNPPRNPKTPSQAAPLYGRGIWHRFLGTLLSSQRADAPGATPPQGRLFRGNFSTLPSRLSTVKSDVSDLFRDDSWRFPTAPSRPDPRAVSSHDPRESNSAPATAWCPFLPCCPTGRTLRRGRGGVKSTPT